MLPLELLFRYIWFQTSMSNFDGIFHSITIVSYKLKLTKTIFLDNIVYSILFLVIFNFYNHIIQKLTSVLKMSIYRTLCR